MMNRVRGYLVAIGVAVLTSLVLADPALAAGLGEAKKKFGFGSVLGTLCCLFVLALVGGGVLIGVLVSRRRRR
jgi:hypothetical protein